MEKIKTTLDAIFEIAGAVGIIWGIFFMITSRDVGGFMLGFSFAVSCLYFGKARVQ